jgi:hypothetical protein
LVDPEGLPVLTNHEFGVMRVSGISDSALLLVTAGDRAMHRPSFRMILFVLVLAAVHMAAMT